MVEMARVLPILVQFGGGAILCAIGIGAGLRSGYLDLSLPADRRAIGIIVAGYFLLLGLACAFTFWLPHLALPGGTT
jgi:hypothetical protein